MPRDDRPDLDRVVVSELSTSGVETCPRVPGLRCPSGNSTICPGRDNLAACSEIARLADWRRLSRAEQVARISQPRVALDPRVRDTVNACPDRGGVLPVSEQADCGCQGVELTECRAGRGRIPGRVTLRECLECGEGRV
jgi:hypothetical protein